MTFFHAAVAALALLVIVVLSLFFGMHVMETEIKKQCDGFGQTRLDNVIFVCTRKQ
jgi:fumarate reductase subunit D